MGRRTNHSRLRCKPTLYEEELPQELLSADPGGMLSALEAPRQARRKFAAFAALIVAIAVAAIGWQWQDAAEQTARTAQAALQAPYPSRVLAAAAVPAPVAAMAPVTSVDLKHGTGSATVIEEKQPQSSAPAAVAASTHDAPRKTQIAMATAPAAPEAAASREAAPPVEAVEAVSAATAMPAPVVRPSREEGNVSGKTALGPARHEMPRADRDVELIAALLSRIAPAPAGSKVQADATPSAAGLSTPARKSRHASTQKPDGKPAFSEALAAQAAQCRALGLFEAELCRLRVCSGKWGTAPGCPHYAQASQETP